MDGLSAAGLGFLLPKNTEGLAVLEIDPPRCVEPGLEGGCDEEAGLNVAAAALGRNSEAFTFRLNLPEIAEVGVCMFDRCGLVIPL